MLPPLDGYMQCDHKKSPNAFKSCPKMFSLEKLKILTPLQKLPKNVGDFGKLIVAKCFKKFPKLHKITQSGHTGYVAVCLVLTIEVYDFTMASFQRKKKYLLHNFRIKTLPQLNSHTGKLNVQCSTE